MHITPKNAAADSVRVRRRSESLPIETKLLMAGIMSIIGYASWVWGGAVAKYQLPQLVFAVILFAGLIMLPYLTQRTTGISSNVFVRTLRSMGRDPVFYLGGTFLLLIALQWLNAGRPAVFDRQLGMWTYAAPRIPWLPSAFTKGEAFEMLVWFFPAWVIALAIRSPLITQKKGVYALWTMMVVNAAALAIFGIVQFASHTEHIYWRIPILYAAFFASFGYPNHAGAFFVLMFCLAGGLCMRNVFSSAKLILDHKTVLWLIVSLLNLAAATLSLSRAAILMAWAAAVCMAVYAIRIGWRSRSSSRRFYFLVLIGSTTAVGLLPVLGAARSLIYREVSSIPGMIPDVIKHGSTRPDFILSALAMWWDHPWFGIGGWGFGYLASEYLKVDPLVLFEPGMANVHCDPVQFLAEFGSVGFALILGVVFILARPMNPRIMRYRPAILFASFGLLLIALHGVIDLPFRCPAVLYSWTAVLAGAGRICSENAHSIAALRSSTNLGSATFSSNGSDTRVSGLT